MRNKVSLGAALLLLLIAPAAGARDFSEADFLAAGQQMVQSMRTLDFESFMSVMGDDGEELSETDWVGSMGLAPGRIYGPGCSSLSPPQTKIPYSTR